MLNERPVHRSACRAVVAILLVLLQAPAGLAQRPADGGLVAVTMPEGTVIMAELAKTVEERARGLMFRPSLDKNRGMLFTFAEPQQWSFWMKNTRIPLDIIWMDGHKKIVHIERRVPTCSRTDDGCPQYQPLCPGTRGGNGGRAQTGTRRDASIPASLGSSRQKTLAQAVATNSQKS
jgi:uncharacterized membrane protein (UPF0127 family)